MIAVDGCSGKQLSAYDLYRHVGETERMQYKIAEEVLLNRQDFQISYSILLFYKWNNVQGKITVSK